MPRSTISLRSSAAASGYRLIPVTVAATPTRRARTPIRLLPASQPDQKLNCPVIFRNRAGMNAVGRRFRAVINNTQQPGPWRTIVGVATTVRMLGPFNNPGVDDTGFYEAATEIIVENTARA